MDDARYALLSELVWRAIFAAAAMSYTCLGLWLWNAIGGGL